LATEGYGLADNKASARYKRVEQFSGAVAAGIAQGFYPKPAQKTWE
jgi:hypothetical protein